MNESRTSNDSRTPGEDIYTLAALYAAGALTTDEQAEVDERVAAGDSVLQAAIASFDATISELANECAPVEPAPNIKAALMVQIAAEAALASEKAKMMVSRASDAQWMPLEVEGNPIEGAEIRILSMDTAADRVTLLLRMQAGASFPAHVHAQSEEFFVLEGDMRWDDLVFHAGDYMHAEPGSLHPKHWSESGCVCLVTTSLANEYV